MVQHSGRGRRSSWPVPLHLEVDRDPAWPPRVSSLAWVRGCGPLKWRLEAGMPGRAKSSEPREGVLSPFPHAHACSTLSPRQSPPSSSPHLFPRRPSGGASRREGNAAPGCPLPFWGCIHCLASDKALKSRRGSGFTWESPYPKVRHGFGDWESTAQGWPTDFRGQESRQYVGSGVGLGPVGQYPPDTRTSPLHSSPTGGGAAAFLRSPRWQERPSLQDTSPISQPHLPYSQGFMPEGGVQRLALYKRGV